MLLERLGGPKRNPANAAVFSLFAMKPIGGFAFSFRGASQPGGPGQTFVFDQESSTHES
jgi:hypothetical protein